ncbi:MAG: 6,7-dimethyl-8-ribityllumazine synthase [Pseudomonadales bacterium]|jgi:6,7-dimethyl-8-ribityllumazine synthase
MSEFRPVEGSFDAGDARFGIVVARWNGDITEGLLEGTLRAFKRHGVNEEQLTVVRVPGAFELPLAAQKLARLNKFDAIVTLGCVIRGGTPHFEYVCSETTRGVGAVALNENLPVAFGLLTTDDLKQAQDRSGDNEENKGEEAALTVLELVSLYKQL